MALSTAKECVQLTRVLDPVLPPDLLDMVLMYLFQEDKQGKYNKCNDLSNELSCNQFLSCLSLSHPRPFYECQCGSESEWVSRCASWIHDEDEGGAEEEVGEETPESFHFWCSECLFHNWDGDELHHDHNLRDHVNDYTFFHFSFRASWIIGRSALFHHDGHQEKA